MENQDINELSQMPKKKKFRKLKIFSIIFILLITFSLVVFYFDYSKSINQQKEEVINDLNQRVESGELSKVEVTGEDYSIRNPLTNINPRHSYINASNSEVAYIDHLGNIQMIGNLTVTNSVNGIVFFRQIGSQATKITTGWFTSLFADSINSTVINSTSFYKGTNTLNATSELDTLYSSIIWGYNQTTATFNLYGQWWYNQTTAAITDINSRFWNRTLSYNKTEIDSFNASWSSTYNETYKNLLNQQCPVGKVVNGTLANGTFTCITDATGTTDLTNVAYLNETQTFTKNQTIRGNLTITNGSVGSFFYENGTCTVWKRGNTEFAICD